MKKNLLRSILVGESRAYGFTIAFWGSGALLISSFGVPGIEEVLLYATGAITGFAAITMLAFSDLFEEAERAESKYLALSMIHYIASLGPILITYYLTNFSSPLAFFFAGASVSIVYNLLQLVEEFMSEKFKHLEERILD